MQDERNVADKDTFNLQKTTFLHQEKLTSKEIDRHGGRLNEANLQRFELGVKEASKTVEINTFMIKVNEDKESRQNMMDKLL